MKAAFCPYCGEIVARHGARWCPSCRENIEDMWEILPPGAPRQRAQAGAPLKSLLTWGLLALAGVLALAAGVAVLSGMWDGAAGEPQAKISVIQEAFSQDQSTEPDASQAGNPGGDSNNTGSSSAAQGGQPDDPRPDQPLVDGQIVLLKCLGHLEGARWLSADVRSGAVYLAASPNDPDCRSCWLVVDPEGDGVIQLLLLSPDGQRLALQADPATERLWVGAPASQSQVQYWQVVAQSDGRLGLYSSASGPERWLDGLTIEGALALAPQPDEAFTGAFWQASAVPPGQLQAFFSLPTPAPQQADACLSASRLSPGMDAAVLEGGGRNRLRKNPSLSAKVIDMIDEGDPVKILDGPECNAGVVWWRVQVLESGKTGWTAEMQDGAYYLRPLP